jgi:hypothetical protein
LDALLAAIQANTDYVDTLEEVQVLLDEHYAAEKPLLSEIRKHSARIAARITTQHAEVLEIGAHLDVARAGGRDDHALRLVQRFQALACQNIIEEERVVFPLSGKWFQF